MTTVPKTDVLGDDHLGFRRGIQTRNAIVVLGIISERIFEHIRRSVCVLHRLAEDT